MPHVALHRIGHTGVLTEGPGSTARVPRGPSVPPHPAPEVICVEVHVRAGQIGHLYTRSEGLRDVIQEVTRPGQVVDYYA